MELLFLKKKIEEISQDCAYNTLSNKGKAMKIDTKDFEKYLIKVIILHIQIL